MLYQNWNRTRVYFELAVSVSYLKPILFSKIHPNDYIVTLPFWLIQGVSFFWLLSFWKELACMYRQVQVDDAGMEEQQ